MIESSTAPGTIASTPLTDTLNKVLCAGIPTNATDHSLQSLQIYPNPVRDRLMVRSDQLRMGQQIVYVVYDLKGRVWMHGLMSSSEPTIYMAKLSPGTYLLRLRNSSSVEFAKFIVE
jgi:hypothetical protein